MPGTRRESIAPDALGQVRRALKNIFRRNKKTKPTAQSASVQDTSSQFDASSRAQTPRSAGRDAPEAHYESTPTQELTHPISIVVHQPTPIIEQSGQIPSLAPPSTLRSGAELSSSPKSPVTLEHPEGAHAAPESQQTAGGGDNAEAIPVAQDAPDGQEEKDDTEETAHVGHVPSHVQADDSSTVRASEGPPDKASPSPKRSLIFHAVRHTESSSEDNRQSTMEPESPRCDSVDAHDAETQRSPSVTDPSSKHHSGPTDVEDGASPLVPHEEPKQANASNRRAPAIFHDEKIPVMAEPPPVRLRAPAPGMVATSGPLEDFPFR